MVENKQPGEVSLNDPIVKIVDVYDKPSSYVSATGGSKTKPMKPKANFHPLSSDNLCEGANVSIPRKIVETFSSRLANALYGYFIGKRIAFPVVEYFVRNNWGKNENMDTRLCKMNGRVPVWVKIHDVPIQAFMKDGLSIIASKIEVSVIPIVDTSKVITPNVGNIPTVHIPSVEKTNDGFQTVGKKKKKKAKSKVDNGGNASNSSSLLKNTVNSPNQDNITSSNSFAALNEDVEEGEVVNVFDETSNLFNSKSGGRYSFTAAVG
ncbi:hypothetical protein Tco_0762212 [Tanacetum coccineum]